MTTVSPTPTISIEEFTIGMGESDVHYRQNGNGTVPEDRGEDNGAVLVRLDVDGYAGAVVAVDLGRSSDVRVLSRAIDALTAVRDQLVQINPGGSYGQCMVVGDWGRCKLRDGHDADTEGEHLFPTEEECRAKEDWYRKASKRIA